MRHFAIIPAAGRSRRMGQPKLLLPWGNATVIEHVLATWRASRVDEVLVVVDPADNELAQRCVSCGAHVVAAPSAPPEMKDSVQLGLDWIAAQQPHENDAWLVAPADMPELTAATIDRLIAARESALGRGSGSERIWAPCHGAKLGHPVLFPWSLAAEVGRLGPDEGLNVLVARHGVECVEVSAAAIAEDFDTPGDYERLRTRHGK